MELVKKDSKPLEYKWKDITFQIRAQATAGDKFRVSMAAPIENGKQNFPISVFYRNVIESFVLGWQGVTEDAKEVPFSLEALERLPCDPTNDVILMLGAFIVNNTGFAEVERKNGSS